MVDLHRLRVWRAVVASGSVHAAAQHLGYTPSTVSQHVKLLQRETGLLLTERVGRGLRPTPAGQRLAQEAEQVLQGLQQLDAVVADLRDGAAEHLAVSCFASVAQEWMPEVAALLRARLPGLVLEVSINEPHEGPGRRPPDLVVHSESVDGGAEQHRREAGMTRHVLGTEWFLAVLPVGHRLAAEEVVRLAGMAEEAWVDNVVYDSATLRILLEACRAAGFVPRWAARCDDHRAALSLVATGLGVAAVPSLAARDLPAGVVARPLVDPTPRRRIVAWQRRATAHTTASRLALGLLRDLAADLPAAVGARLGPAREAPRRDGA